MHKRDDYRRTHGTDMLNGRTAGSERTPRDSRAPFAYRKAVQEAAEIGAGTVSSPFITARLGISLGVTTSTNEIYQEISARNSEKEL